jgi:hypothetical protein
MTPLEIFYEIWDETIPSSVILRIEAVNYQTDTNSLPDEWAAVAYQPETRSDVTLGSNPWVEEQGAFLIGLLTRSGMGPAPLDPAVDYIRQKLHAARRNGLVILQVDGPHDVDPDGFGEWWQITMTARYIFQTRRAGTDPLHGGWIGFPEAPPAALPEPP